jgi:hypothetical protein
VGNNSENYNFKKVKSLTTAILPYFSETIFLFKNTNNSDEIYVRCLKDSTEYLKIKTNEWDIFAIKNKALGLINSNENFKDKIKVGETIFGPSEDTYLMITFYH